MLSKLRWFWAVLDRVGWIIALAFLAVGFFVVKGQGVSLNELRISQLRGCHRLNIVRAEDNRSQLHDFDVFTATAALLSAAATHPDRPATPAEAKRARAYIEQIEEDALAKEWTPLSHCYPATYHPRLYAAPTPRPFAREERHGKHVKRVLRLPPRSALYLGPGE